MIPQLQSVIMLIRSTTMPDRIFPFQYVEFFQFSSWCSVSFEQSHSHENQCQLYCRHLHDNVLFFLFLVLLLSPSSSLGHHPSDLFLVPRMMPFHLLLVLVLVLLLLLMQLHDLYMLSKPVLQCPKHVDKIPMPPHIDVDPSHIVNLDCEQCTIYYKSDSYQSNLVILPLHVTELYNTHNCTMLLYTLHFPQAHLNEIHSLDNWHHHTDHVMIL
mmetsp:Transcript_7428/g.14047  ORF Transcript_7428/g.14047 Transcript_7428/m.14047 type:complete len:214 (+) Transcript_7428:307-948(+)